MPDDDGQAQVLSSRPPLLVENVRLNERPEALHGGVVPCGPDAAHRSDHVDHVVSPQFTSHGSASGLAAPVRVQDAPGDVSAAGHSVAEGLDGELRGHPVADRVPEDPVGVGVFERATAEFAIRSSNAPRYRSAIPGSGRRRGTHAGGGPGTPAGQPSFSSPDGGVAPRRGSRPANRASMPSACSSATLPDGFRRLSIGSRTLGLPREHRGGLIQCARSTSASRMGALRYR